MTPSLPTKTACSVPAWAPSRRAVVLAVAGLWCATACSGGNHVKATATTFGNALPSATGCPLTGQDAIGVIGTSTPATLVPLGPAVPQPLQRCNFGTLNRSLQLTVFSGTTVFTQMRTLNPNAKNVPQLGTSSYCGGQVGPSMASWSCIFVKGGNSYVLALGVPAAQDNEAMHSQLQSLAIDIAARVPGSSS